MLLAGFLRSLLGDGSIRVAASVNRSGTLLVPSAEDLSESVRILKSFEADYRNELAGTPPVVSDTALVWGALTVFRATSFLVHRDSAAEVMAAAFEAPGPGDLSPSVCYSVDLTLRFFPDLVS